MITTNVMNPQKAVIKTGIALFCFAIVIKFVFNNGIINR